MDKNISKKTVAELIEEEIQKQKIPEEYAQKLRKLAKNPKQETKRQHWVPEFYLKKFVGEDNLLQTFDVHSNKIGKRYAPKSVCSEKFFYASWTGKKDDRSQYIENMFRTLENDFSDLSLEFEKVVWSYEHIKDEMLWGMSLHIALQYLRTPYIRKKTLEWEKQFHESYLKMMSCNEQAWTNLMKEYRAENPNITDEELNDVRDTFQNIDTQKKTIYLMKSKVEE